MAKIIPTSPLAKVGLGRAKRVGEVKRVPVEEGELRVKRFKVDAKFTPAPVNNNVRLVKKPTVRMDDLKKMLAEHNQRIRPVLKRS